MLSQPIHVLRGHSGATARLSRLPQKILLILQAAFSLVLVSVAVLTARSLHNLSHQETGFAIENSYTLQLDVPMAGKSAQDQRELYNQIQSRIAGLGGVTSVGLASFGPYERTMMGQCFLLVDDLSKNPKHYCHINLNQVNPQYFDAIGVPILKGRNFNATDTSGSLSVAIVNKVAANLLFPDLDPIGKHFALIDEPSNVFQIIGVAGDYKINPYEPAPGFSYRPLAQTFNAADPVSIQSFVVRFRSVPEDPDGMIRRALSQVDPDLSVTYLRSMDSRVAGTLSEERLIADLALIFAILAVALASIGLYGITSYIAIQRTNEIAVRVALGSTRFGIVLCVVRGVIGQVGVGILLGIPFVFAAGYWMKTLLFDVSWYDLTGLNLAILFLILCSIVAELIPAYRAASVEPMKALRTE